MYASYTNYDKKAFIGLPPVDAERKLDNPTLFVSRFYKRYVWGSLYLRLKLHIGKKLRLLFVSHDIQIIKVQNGTQLCNIIFFWFSGKKSRKLDTFVNKINLFVIKRNAIAYNQPDVTNCKQLQTYSWIN